jgi:hypothetical protein
MQRRLHDILRKSSEARAFLVLLIVLPFWGYRRLQRKWTVLPTFLDVLAEIDRRVNVWITYQLYEAHWL